MVSFIVEAWNLFCHNFICFYIFFIMECVRMKILVDVWRGIRERSLACHQGACHYLKRAVRVTN